MYCRINARLVCCPKRGNRYISTSDGALVRLHGTKIRPQRTKRCQPAAGAEHVQARAHWKLRRAWCLQRGQEKRTRPLTLETPIPFCYAKHVNTHTYFTILTRLSIQSTSVWKMLLGGDDALHSKMKTQTPGKQVRRGRGRGCLYLYTPPPPHCPSDYVSILNPPKPRSGSLSRLRSSLQRSLQNLDLWKRKSISKYLNHPNRGKGKPLTRTKPLLQRGHANVYPLYPVICCLDINNRSTPRSVHYPPPKDYSKAY